MIIFVFSCEENQDYDEWLIISSIDKNINSIYFIDSQNGWVVGDSGYISYTSDGGYTWTKQNSMTNSKLKSIYFLDNNTGFACGYNNTLIHTDDKGNTWMPIQVVSDSGSIYSSINSDNDGNLYFISNYGEVYWSNNLGVTWNNKHNFDNWGFSYLDFSNNPICYAMQTMGKYLHKTNDGGNSWSIYTIPLQWSGDIYFFDKDHGWITENLVPSSMIHNSTSVYMTNDGGLTWVQQSSLSGLVLNNIVFVDIFHGWVSGVTEIYYTTDNGKSWTRQFKSDDEGYIKDIYFIDSNTGWAITSEGIVIKYNCD
jgi:photosystem II stability/assembly factor-like uncharacterized protein